MSSKMTFTPKTVPSVSSKVAPIVNNTGKSQKYTVHYSHSVQYLDYPLQMMARKDFEVWLAPGESFNDQFHLVSGASIPKGHWATQTSTYVGEHKKNKGDFCVKYNKIRIYKPKAAF